MSEPQLRRVVLAQGPDGATEIVTDGPATSVTELPAVPGTALIDLWRSDAVPMSLGVTSDPTAGDFELMPPGSLFRVIDLAPTQGEPMWHQTDSVDFIYVANGTVRCCYEGGEVRLNAGDTIVQQGVRHAWVNDGQAICRLINVSVAAS